MVGGAFGIVQLVTLLWQQKKSRDLNYLGDDDDDFDDDGVVSRSCRFSGYFVGVFLLAWFVLGNVWVFEMWQPNFTQPLHDPQNWCQRVVFLFTFYHLMVVYGMLALVLLAILVTVFVYIITRCRRHSNSASRR